MGKTDVNGTRMDAEFGSIPISFSLGGLFGLNSKILRTNQDHRSASSSRQRIDHPHPEGLNDAPSTHFSWIVSRDSRYG
jgi:hypothetical protein